MILPSIDLIGVVIALFGNFVLGLVTYVKNPRSATSKLFFLFTTTVGIYLLLNHLALNQTSDHATLVSIRLVMATALLINVLFFLLSVAFPFPKLNIKKWQLYLILVSTALLIFFTQTNLIFSSVKTGTTQPIPGIGIPFFLLHTIVLLGGGLWALFRKLKNSSGVVKTQIRLLVLGTIFMFGAILTTNLLFVLVLQTTAFVGLLPIYTLIFFGFISYAIVRHRFLDIGFIIARTISYLFLLLLVSLIYIGVLYGIGLLIFDLKFTLGQQLALLAITFFIATTFSSIKRVVSKVTDRYFYKGSYDTSQVLNTISHIAASTIQLDELTHGILQVILKQIHILRGAFILLDTDKITAIKSVGYTTSPQFKEDEINQLSNSHNTLIFDEIEDVNLKEILRNLELSIVIQLRTDGHQIGLLILAGKESGDTYTQQDLELLEILAPEVSVAIQNSQAYEEIRRFNITLQEEVDRATSELRDANEKLKQLDKLKDEFVSLASHELRTPMTAVKSYTWMVLNGKADTPEKQKEYLNIVYVSVERLLHLVNDMLDISRIESGRVQMAPVVFDMNEMAALVQNEFMAKATERHIDLQLVKADQPANVNADKNKMQEVVENLVSNAVKFTPENGHITISITHQDGKVKTSITDTGKGISQEDSQKLFKKFGRLDNSLTGMSSEPGTGLGLFICKQYTELNGGTIWVESEVGKGATFAFTLPQV